MERNYQELARIIVRNEKKNNWAARIGLRLIARIIKLRQKSIALSSASISVRMLEPVVVNPETVSKKASMNPGICLLMTKGRQPNKLSNIHAMPVMARPSRA